MKNTLNINNKSIIDVYINLEASQKIKHKEKDDQVTINIAEHPNNVFMVE